MTLEISKEHQRAFSDGKCRLSVDMINNSATHLFIASNKWDKILIHIDDSIKFDMIRYLPKVSSNIKVTLPEKVTIDTVGVLASLYPDLSASLRRTFMSGKDIREVLKECLEL